MLLPPDDADRLLRHVGRLPKPGVTIAGGHSTLIFVPEQAEASRSNCDMTCDERRLACNGNQAA
jgi:hypothetical protein